MNSVQPSQQLIFSTMSPKNTLFILTGLTAPFFNLNFFISKIQHRRRQRKWLF
ncbi:Hypothetical protein GbCGDNIH9_8584 [Granulibacter bethesdensis]|uniref:Uncharacterized protein n=1 Tax=Granulibacter bethesdensis TaxID=364410 RepID=A0AAC9KAT9_9PROT|nr:Hypothetical protein GbCGDNIH9_8584 [Granulibacter bethesdensis]APH62410.1 Hypothetical protein GbCGDNIH8_8584 [Granulibacter bethesdensis]